MTPSSRSPPAVPSGGRWRHGRSGLDPSCGSGTIAIEAALLPEGGGPVVASDIDANAATVTRRNASEGARVRVRTVCCDTGVLAFRPGSIDRVISNPPWDHQVSWSRSGRSAGSLQDVLAEDFRIVLLELEEPAAKARVQAGTPSRRSRSRCAASIRP